MTGFAATEFFARGLTWVQVFVVGLWMAAPDYGVLVLIVSAEAILGVLAAAPACKRVLRNGGLCPSAVTASATTFLVAAPMFLIVSAFVFGTGVVLREIFTIGTTTSA